MFVQVFVRVPRVAVGVIVLALGCGPEAREPNVAPVMTSTAPAEPSSVPSTPASASAPSPSADADAGLKALVKTVLVRETRVDCEGEGARKCLQVRETASDPWTTFYDRIVGFSYEEGTKYELRVALETEPNPRADAPSLRYRLVEIVSQEKVSAPTNKH
ncbi:MAG TPA: DUF4377 domain-containing protein [Labilithrix sp.]|nr:DUF4377 domain-containing protein [Labilithrix sp.]